MRYNAAMSYMPRDKKPVEPPLECRCAECNRPLKTGLAYFALDEATDTEIPLGPKCFKDLTGHKPSAATVLALGAVVEEGEGEAKQKKPSLAKTFKTAGRLLTARQKTARANVLLRAHILPERGFVSTDADQFAEFLGRADNLTAEDMNEIESRVARTVRNDERRELEQLRFCYTVHVQIERLLASGKVPSRPTEIMESFEENLHSYNGLTNKQMDLLHNWAAIGWERYKIPDAIEGIHFPANEARHIRAAERNAARHQPGQMDLL
jgi:hypothetical protein